MNLTSLWFLFFNLGIYNIENTISTILVCDCINLAISSLSLKTPSSPNGNDKHSNKVQWFQLYNDWFCQWCKETIGIETGFINHLNKTNIILLSELDTCLKWMLIFACHLVHTKPGNVLNIPFIVLKLSKSLQQCTVEELNGQLNWPRDDNKQISSYYCYFLAQFCRLENVWAWSALLQHVLTQRLVNQARSYAHSQLHGARWEIPRSLLNIDIIRLLHKILPAELWTQAHNCMFTKQNVVERCISV